MERDDWLTDDVIAELLFIDVEKDPSLLKETGPMVVMCDESSVMPNDVRVIEVDEGPSLDSLPPRLKVIK